MLIKLDNCSVCVVTEQAKLTRLLNPRFYSKSILTIRTFRGGMSHCIGFREVRRKTGEEGKDGFRGTFRRTKLRKTGDASVEPL